MAFADEGRKTTLYFQKKWGEAHRGRRFARGFQSLQSIARPIRHTIAGDLYYDPDLENAHPVALAHFCGLHGIPCPELQGYNEPRDPLQGAD